jgi:hypothetical protein
MFFILITFLLYIFAFILKANLVDKYSNNLESYVTSHNPESNSDVDRLTRQYYNSANHFYFGL